jgi:hypothetical protein
LPFRSSHTVAALHREQLLDAKITEPSQSSRGYPSTKLPARGKVDAAVLTYNFKLHQDRLHELEQSKQLAKAVYLCRIMQKVPGPKVTSLSSSTLATP